MGKRIVALLVVISLSLLFMPTVSRAAVTPYFVAANDTLLPFSTDTMPFISGGEIFVPVKVFDDFNVWASGSVDMEMVRLYGEHGRFIDFYTVRGVTVDQDGNDLSWPPARRIGRRFYVPLRQVCGFFDLTYEIFEIPRDIIADEQMWIIRIITNANFNNPTFLGLNRNAIIAAYNEYTSPPPPPSLPPVGTPPDPTPTEPVHSFSDVTIHLSFFDVTGENASGVLDILDIQVAPGYQSCFFVSADEIRENPGLIRRISGKGHSIGVLLAEGTYEEYLEASALLFEAAKVKTVLVAVEEEFLADITADGNGLVIWEYLQSFVDTETTSLAAITDEIPRESGARANLMFSCSEDTASVLRGVITHLWENEYTVERITETVEPLSGN